MEVVIRNFKPEDVEGLYELDRACYAPEFRLEYPRLRALLLDGSVAVLVAEVAQHAPDEQGLIAGLLVKRDGGDGQAPPRLAIVSLMVHPEFRRAGLGRRLLDWAMRLGRANGAEVLVAPLEGENRDGAEFLAAQGFERGDGSAFFANEQDGALWQHRLDQPPGPPAPPANGGAGARQAPGAAPLEPAAQAAEREAPEPQAPAPEAAAPPVHESQGSAPAEWRSQDGAPARPRRSKRRRGKHRRR